MELQETDENLMTRYQAGEKEAFSELYRRYHLRLYGYLRHQGVTDGAVDEIFQNIWMKLHQSRFRYEAKFKFSAWLFTISRSTTIDFWRKEGKLPQWTTLDEEKASSIAAEPQETLVQKPDLPWGLLSAEDKQALEWRYLEEADFEEIGQRLGLSSVSVRQRVSRALKKLRKEFLKRNL